MAVQRWLRSPNARSTADLRQYFASLAKHYRYANIVLLDTEGRIRMRLHPSNSALSPDIVDLGNLAISSRKSLHRRGPSLRRRVCTAHRFHRPALRSFSDTLCPSVPYYCRQIRTTSCSPCCSRGRRRAKPGKRCWSGATGRNPLHQRTPPRQRYRIPHASPAERNDAARGVNHSRTQWHLQRLDHRGEPVISALKPVAGTGWFLVAKTDQREATANSQLITRLIALLTIGLILGTGSFFSVLWHSRDKHRYRALFEAESVNRELQERFGTAFRASPLPVSITNVADGRFVDVNTRYGGNLWLEA